MIISKTPFRISFLGGGSDLIEYYQDEPGCVISTTINKYMYLSIHKYFHENKQLIKYSQTEEISSNQEIKHNIIREVFKYYNINNADFNSTADIPSGTGMASSSAFTCGLINLCSNLNKIKINKNEIAKLACFFEIDILKEPIGKQDQYACANGGLNLITFYPNNDVTVNEINIKKDKLLKLENNLFLYYTTITRKASSILYNQQQNTKNNVSTKNNLRKMVNMANNLFKDLLLGNIDILGEYLKEAWILKKELSNGISNEFIDEMYTNGLKYGATGGKLLGAGGGGFLLFYVPDNNHIKFLQGMNKYKIFDFQFENSGTSIVYNDQIF